MTAMNVDSNMSYTFWTHLQLVIDLCQFEPWRVLRSHVQSISPSTANQSISHCVRLRLCSLAGLWQNPTGYMSWQSTMTAPNPPSSSWSHIVIKSKQKNTKMIHNGSSQNKRIKSSFRHLIGYYINIISYYLVICYLLLFFVYILFCLQSTLYLFHHICEKKEERTSSLVWTVYETLLDSDTAIIFSHDGYLVSLSDPLTSLHPQPHHHMPKATTKNTSGTQAITRTGMTRGKWNWFQVCLSVQLYVSACAWVVSACYHKAGVLSPSLRNMGSDVM